MFRTSSRETNKGIWERGRWARGNAQSRKIRAPFVARDEVNSIVEEEPRALAISALIRARGTLSRESCVSSHDWIWSGL